MKRLPFRHKLDFFFILIPLFALSACLGEPESRQAKIEPTAVLETAVPISTPLPPPIIIPDATTDVPSTPDAPEGSEIDEPTAVPFASLPGALIQISMQSQVGVLLDEIPVEMRDLVAADLLAQSNEAWLARATRQVRLTRNRLTFRDFIYAERGQLPLPPMELWDIRLDSDGPTRQTIQGHDLIMIGYSFSSTLLTDAQSPGLAEPALSDVGGIWEEPFIFPADPDLLLQRTGNACINEGGFPPNSFDSENIWHFYDFACTTDSGGAGGCHRSYLPNFSCLEALATHVGDVSATMRFERLAWDDELAAQVRLGEVTSWDTPDLTAVADDLATNRIIYRYFEEGDCAAEEGAVGGSGWRRLLQFDATVWNVGAEAMHIGQANVEDTENHVFTYSPCHDHFHYSNYGDFFLEDAEGLTGSKQAFCVQSTVRMSNNEAAPLTHSYSCSFQGIKAGWADEYIAGLDAQWIDITDLEIPPERSTVQLGFTSNGDQFLCEGTPMLDENGDQLWEPSSFTAADGDSINRPQCDFIPDWAVNNQAVTAVILPPTGGFVIEPCVNGEIGPLRNCGFTEVKLDEVICIPGTAVIPTLPDTANYPLVLRVCERSAELGAGVACTYGTSLINTIIMAASDTTTFICPVMRDSGESAGSFALYTAPLLEFVQR